jgi:hypothetical protein
MELEERMMFSATPAAGVVAPANAAAAAQQVQSPAEPSTATDANGTLLSTASNQTAQTVSSASTSQQPAAVPVTDAASNTGQLTMQATASDQGIAQLPQLPTTFDVPYTLPTGGTTFHVKQGDDLQAVFDQAALGDVIVLDAGATFTGNFKLPNKTGEGWIYIVSSELDQLQEGVRVGPADASHMPKIVSPNSDPALFTVFAAHNYRFAGLEIYSSTHITNLILMGYGLTNYSDPIYTKTAATSLDQLPYNITFDRCYIHVVGDSTYASCGIMADGKYVAVVNSYLSNFKTDDSNDAAAIKIWNGLGPYKIINNYLEASGENILFGGVDPAITGLVPSDIEIRGNYFYKPNTWNPNSSEYNGHVWVIKNLFEIKNAQRVLLEGNVFDNCWEGGQSGRAIVFKASETPSSTKCWDVTFQNNIIRNAAGGIEFLEAESGQTNSGIERILVRNNLFDLTSTDSWVGTLWMFATDGKSGMVAEDITIDHNTMLGKIGCEELANCTSLDSFNNITITNNIFRQGIYGFKGSGYSSGKDTMDAYFVDYTFIKNLIVDLPATGENSLTYYPSGNFNAVNINSVGFMDYANGNYRLASTSPYKNAGTNGKDLGPDWDALVKAIRNTVSGAGSLNVGSAVTTLPAQVSPLPKVMAQSSILPTGVAWPSCLSSRTITVAVSYMQPDGAAALEMPANTGAIAFQESPRVLSYSESAKVANLVALQRIALDAVMSQFCSQGSLAAATTWDRLSLLDEYEMPI